MTRDQQKKTTMASQHYYHAGVRNSETWDVLWSSHTRRTRHTAVGEARRMARRHGGEPVVEWWEREHGLRPGHDVSEGLAAVGEAVAATTEQARG